MGVPDELAHLPGKMLERSNSTHFSYQDRIKFSPVTYFCCLKVDLASAVLAVLVRNLACEHFM